VGHGGWGRRGQRGGGGSAEGLGVDPPPPLTRGGWVEGRVVATRRGDTGDKTVSGEEHGRSRLAAAANSNQPDSVVVSK